MNFHELMAKAAENQESKKAQVATVKRYNTAIPPPKKEVKQKGISPNVRAFLAKKEEEAKKKVVEQKKFREKYLDKSKQCYRKVQNIHELIKEETAKDEPPEDSDLAHIKPTSNKSAADANSSFNGTSSSAQKSGTAKAETKSEKSDTAKKKRKGNAPSFAELMKLAAEGKKNANEKASNVRPMTAKEKEELDRAASHKKTKEYRIWAEYGPSALEKYKAQQRLKQNGGKPLSSDSESSPAISPKPVDAKSVTKEAKNSQAGISKAGTKRTSNGSPVVSSKANDRTISGGKQGRTKARASPPPPPPPPPSRAPKYDITNENVLVCRPAAQQSAWDRVYNHSRPPPRGPGDELASESEESEYDDEDGFIDDGPLVDPYASTISNEIRSIFGYDRRKYKDFDDDDRNMETSFREQMKEEARSARLGLKEDQEDIRREEEELKRKQVLKKKMKR